MTHALAPGSSFVPCPLASLGAAKAYYCYYYYYYKPADYITKYKTNPRLLNRTTGRTPIFGELWTLLEQYNTGDIG